MISRRWAGCALVCIALAGCGRAAPTLGPARVPQRIASLTLATDELLADLVPVERIVGVTHLADDAEISNVAGRYPASIPRLRDRDPEHVIELAPDLVCVAPYNSADFLKLMERSGLPIYRNEALDSFDAIEKGIVNLGAAVGEPERAAELVKQMRQRRERLAERVRDVSKRPRVLYWSAGFTAGRNSTIDDIIREAGGVNVAAQRDLSGSAPFSPEQVIAADPDIILLSRWSGDEREGRIENHPLLRNLRAVRENRVIAIEGKYLLSVSHSAVAGAEQLSRRLHPERLTAARPGTGTPRVDPEGAP